MTIRPALILTIGLAVWAPLVAGCGIFNPGSALDMSDPAIRARVLQELKTHAELDLNLLQINVHVRVVYLSGVVPDNRMKRTMEQVVRRVPGVRQVVVNLLIQE